MKLLFCCNSEINCRGSNIDIPIKMFENIRDLFDHRVKYYTFICFSQVLFRLTDDVEYVYV